ncbi:MAG TPA: oligosaccharide flippase family protein [Candidatus Limnocylindria bacterium]|nr:oligosaccharide flippase family protein [Candidatus Limnocylindria bacterium]
MKLRALLRGSLLYTLGNFLPRIGAFLLLPAYTAAMAPSEFGVYSLMVSLIGLLAIVYRLGLDGALLRFHFDVAPPRRPALYFSSTATTVGAAVVLSLVIAAVSAPFFSRIFPGVAFWPYGVLALTITATTALQYVPASLFRALERPELFLAFGLGVFGLGSAATLLFLFVFQRGAGGALAGQLVGGLVVVAVTAFILLRMPRRRFDVELMRRSLRFGLPLLPHGLAGWSLNFSDRWLMGLTIGLSTIATQAAVGIYSFGYVIGQAGALVAVSFNAAWVPFWYARGDGPRGPQLLREATTLVMAVLAVLTVGVAAFAPELTRLLATRRWGNDALGAIDVTVIVAFASLVYGLYFMVVSTVFLRRTTAALPLITLAAGAVNVASNLLLIPRLGIMGAAWSTLAGYLVLAGLTWWYGARTYPISLDVPRLGLLAVGAAAAVAISRLLRPEAVGVWVAGPAHVGVAIGFGLLLIPLLLGPLRSFRQLLADERIEEREARDARQAAATMGRSEEQP